MLRFQRICVNASNIFSTTLPQLGQQTQATADSHLVQVLFRTDLFRSIAHVYFLSNVASIPEM